jgi:hypothetical protein
VTIELVSDPERHTEVVGHSRRPPEWRSHFSIGWKFVPSLGLKLCGYADQVMIEEEPPQGSLAEQVLWCLEKRIAMAKELAQYFDGTLSVGIPKADGTMTIGTRTQILFLETRIERLDRIINSFSPPRDARA